MSLSQQGTTIANCFFGSLFCFVFLEKERENMEKGEAELGGVGRGERIWLKYSVG